METRNQHLYNRKLSSQSIIIVLLVITAILLIIAIYAVNGRSQMPLMQKDEESSFDPNYAASKADHFKREAQERNVPTLNLEPRRFNQEANFKDSAARYVAMYEADNPVAITPAVVSETKSEEKSKAELLEEELLQKLYTRKAEALLNAISSSTKVNLSEKPDQFQKRLPTESQEAYAAAPYSAQYLNDAQAKLAAIKARDSTALGSESNMLLNASASQYGAPGANLNGSRTLSAYDSLTNSNTLLNTKIESVLSPYLLRQGTVIPCILLSGINSEIPGQVQAQVTEDVYDTPYGNYVLIPKGSKVIGQYASGVMMGAERLMLGFNRIIFPDGKAMNLGAMAGSSPDGYAGFEAEVDNHWWRLLSNAVLLGGVTAGVSIAVDEPRDENGNLTVNGALSQALGQSIGRVLTNVIERNLSVAPTLKVKPGFNFNVTMTKDIYFPHEFVAYDYE